MAPLMDRFIGSCENLEDFLQKRKTADGSYPDGLLDTLIKEAESA
jgi:hypothetical protein